MPSVASLVSLIPRWQRFDNPKIERIRAPSILGEVFPIPCMIYWLGIPAFTSNIGWRHWMFYLIDQMNILQPKLLRIVWVVLSGGKFCFDDGTLSVISKISDVIEKNASKKDLSEQVLELLQRGNWKYKVGGIPKMSEAIATGAWRSDDGWCHLIQAMESCMEGDLHQTNELVTKEDVEHIKWKVSKEVSWVFWCLYLYHS